MMEQAVKLAPAGLPAGYTARPARLEDLPAVIETLNATSEALLGVAKHVREEWQSMWQRPGADLEGDTQLVLTPEGRAAAFAQMWDSAPHVQMEQWGRVHPAHTGRGLGTYLMAWAEARARAALPRSPEGTRVVLQTWLNSLDEAAHGLMRDWGYELVRHNLRMVIDLDGPPPAAEWPAGVTVRNFVLGQDERPTLHAIRESFRDHWGFVERPFEERLANWTHELHNDPDFDPSLVFLAMAGGEIVGTSFSRMKISDQPDLAWIATLGVIRPWRRKGIALALLRHSFEALYARGRRRVGLGVDAGSLTGATRLYEKAGMRPEPKHQYGVWEKEIRPGAAVRTETL